MESGSRRCRKVCVGGVSHECALENALALDAANSSIDRHDRAETCVTVTWRDLRLLLEAEIERRHGRFSEVSSGLKSRS